MAVCSQGNKKRADWRYECTFEGTFVDDTRGLKQERYRAGYMIEVIKTGFSLAKKTPALGRGFYQVIRGICD